MLAGWFHREWSTFDGRSVKVIEAQLAENLSRDSIPITFLAIEESILVGTVSLDLSDLPSHDHLSPWLASLFVLPAARGQGIGTDLIRHAQEFARSQAPDGCISGRLGRNGCMSVAAGPKSNGHSTAPVRSRSCIPICRPKRQGDDRQRRTA
jgi:GNAT superfamily N-acetyltransferase